MATSSTLDIGAFINERKVGSFQIFVVALCALTVFLDGFDVQSIAFVAPSLAADWHIERGALGPILVISLVGLMIGALLFGPTADKIGRRWVLMICTLVFGGCTLLTSSADNVTQLMIFRFLTGLGLGGAMPNAIALTAEYCPQHRRATLVMIMFTGFSAGAAAGGAIAAWLIPHFGWRSVFYLGGALPLLLLPLQFAWLPESIRFLVVTKAAHERIATLVRRIDRTFSVPMNTKFDIAEVHTRGVPVLELFRDGRALGTICLWVMFFMNLAVLFFLQNWIAIITNALGIPIQTAIIIASLFQVGGTAAALVTGFAIDYFGAYRVLPLMYALGCLFVGFIGQAGASVALLMALTFGAGFCVVGGQNSANAVAAMFYPTAMRSTGVGWSFGIGRIGTILGTLFGGLLISLHWSNASIFLILCVPVFIAMVAVAVMGRVYKV